MVHQFEPLTGGLPEFDPSPCLISQVNTAGHISHLLVPDRRIRDKCCGMAHLELDAEGKQFCANSHCVEWVSGSKHDAVYGQDLRCEEGCRHGWRSVLTATCPPLGSVLSSVGFLLCARQQRARSLQTRQLQNLKDTRCRQRWGRSLSKSPSPIRCLSRERHNYSALSSGPRQKEAQKGEDCHDSGIHAFLANEMVYGVRCFRSWAQARRKWKMNGRDRYSRI